MELLVLCGGELPLVCCFLRIGVRDNLQSEMSRASTNTEWFLQAERACVHAKKKGGISHGGIYTFYGKLWYGGRTGDKVCYFFFQGCPMRCLYCHNPDTWKIGTGTKKDGGKSAGGI